MQILPLKNAILYLQAVMYKYKTQDHKVWTFITQHKVKYTFSLTYPSSLIHDGYSPGNIAIVEFGFGASKKKRIADPRVAETLIHFLNHFIDVNSNCVVLFKCLTASRERLFKKWYSDCKTHGIISVTATVFGNIFIVRSNEFSYIDDLDKLVAYLQKVA